MDLFSAASKADPAAIRRIKEWTREILNLGEEVAVTVNELRCVDEDCPDVETVIGVFFGPGRQERWKLMAPAAGIGREQLAAVFSELPPKRST
jgi:hypothetical protein